MYCEFRFGILLEESRLRSVRGVEGWQCTGARGSGV